MRMQQSYLEIQVDDVVGVDVVNSLKDLLHDDAAVLP
jgi:hypothetical protein